MTASFGTPPRARIAVLAVLLAALLGVVGARLFLTHRFDSSAWTKVLRSR